MPCTQNCKKINSAVIGTSFIIGCTPCPPNPCTFSDTARKGDSTVKLYKYRFRKVGIKI